MTMRKFRFVAFHNEHVIATQDVISPFATKKDKDKDDDYMWLQRPSEFQAELDKFMDEVRKIYGYFSGISLYDVEDEEYVSF